MSDWDDRAVDAALQELHGSKPPDLSARVLVALRQEPGGPLPQLLPRRRRWWPLAAALLASLALGLASAAGARWWTGPDGDVLAVALEVHRGRIECVESGAVRAIAAGESALPFAARPGNRLRAPVESSLRFDAFGRLDAAAHTELEVRSMDVTRKNGIVVASSLTLAVVSGTVGWYAGSHTETARAGEVLQMQAPASNEAVALATEKERLAKRVLELEQSNEKLLAQIAARESAPPAVAAATAAPEQPAGPAPAAAPAPPAFSDPSYADALAKVDWAAVGQVTNELAPMLTKLAEALAEEGAELPMELVIEIQKTNLKLLEPVGELLQGGIPGYGPNGAYTHPLVVANTLAGALAGAGQALTQAQRQQIDGLVRSFSTESKTISDTQGEFPLEQLLAEVEMKDRFYEQVGSLLAPEQHAAVYPKGATDFEGTSLFSTGVLTRMQGEPLEVADAADYARIASSRLQEQLGLDASSAARVREVIAQTAGANADLWRNRAVPAETSQAHFLRQGRTKTALRTQLAWMRAIKAQVSLTPEQLKKLAKSRVFVPLPR